MIKIRTRLLIYFTVILVFAVGLSYIQKQNNEKIVHLYDESMDRSFLLNEMSSVTNSVVESLTIYVLEPSPENQSNYNDGKMRLLKLQEKFQATNRFIDRVTMKDFQSITTSFLEHTEITVKAVKQKDVQQYSYHLREAEDVSGYINEMTQDLINQELTNYQNLYGLVKQKIASMERMGTSIFFTIILLSILFAYWFSDGIVSTISRLTRAAKEITMGRYAGEDVTVSTKDELYFLTKTFNLMKKSIYDSVKEIEEKSKLAQLLKEMELRSLQNQMNPHFLFNTLNVISKTAYIEGAERTSELITSVSTLLRYNLGDMNKPRILADELNIINEYVFIQKTRFGERVEFIQNIDQACLHTPIPCLTLQPIIENAFIHGIEDIAEDAIIELNISQNSHFVSVEIKDNGVGIEPKVIERIFHVEDIDHDRENANPNSNGIGMRNVIARLQLFNKENKVSIHSEIGTGTKVIIQLAKH